MAAAQPALAVELLEAGRGVLWAQRLETRASLRSLERVAPALVSALQNCRSRFDEDLEELTKEPLDVIGSDTG